MKESQENSDCYSQPEFYRFNEDSIFLAKIVAENILKTSINKNKIRKEKSEKLKILDLCSGCGIIGIEILNILKIKNFDIDSIKVDFCEIQKEFAPHLNENLDKHNLNTKNNSEIYWCDFLDLIKNEKKENYYDIIVSNPPYYLDHQNRLSPQNVKRNRCRFWSQTEKGNFHFVTEFLLKKGGSVFCVGAK
jgi:tRNA1Val (adenine37-N6)-methyltransferase